MNNLSLILYLADILPSIAVATRVVCFLSFLAVGFAYLVGVTNGFGDWDEDDPLVLRLRSLKGWFIAIPFVFVFSFSIPTERETYYVIAASEIGEEILNTPEVGKARKALNNWLDKQLTEENDD